MGSVLRQLRKAVRRMSKYEDDIWRMFDRAARASFSPFDGARPFGAPSREEQLELALREAANKIQEQQAFINKLKAEPHIIGTVQKLTSEGRAIVAVRGTEVEINVPADSVVGSQVRTLASTSQALSRLDAPAVFGAIVKVARLRGRTIEYEAGMGSRVSHIADFIADAHRPQVGDRVRLDPSGTVVLECLGSDTESFTVATQRVTWDDIGGLHEAKEAIREALEYPILFADIYARFGQRPSRGVLLYGPPGCGKTLLGKAAATALGDASGFIYVKGAEVLSKYVGESESTVRQLFDRARAYKRRTGNCAVVFVDEAEALLSARGGPGQGVSSLTVPSFLAEMDGLEDSGAFVMLSTNRPDSLDPAIVRDGRIDRRVRVGRPDRPSAEQVLRIALRERPCDADALVELSMREMFDDRHALYELHFEQGTRELVCLRDMLSGAVISGFVNRAAEHAIRRARSGNVDGDFGISLDDMRLAITDSFRELGVQSFGVVLEKVETIGRIPTTIRKAAFYAGSEEPHFGPALEFGANRVQAAGGGAPN